MKSAFFSKNAVSKPVNGDRCGIFQIKQATIILLADGSGAHPCDWKASQIATESFIHYANTIPTIDNSSQVFACLVAAQKSVAEIHGLCQGALTTFSAIVILGNGRFWLANIGSNTIFQWLNGQLTVLMPPNTHTLTQTTLQEQHIHTGALLPSDGLLCTSDGITAHPSVGLEPLARWMQQSDPESGTSSLIQVYSKNQTEDYSAAMVVMKNGTHTI